MIVFPIWSKWKGSMAGSVVWYVVTYADVGGSGCVCSKHPAAKCTKKWRWFHFQNTIIIYHHVDCVFRFFFRFFRFCRFCIVPFFSSPPQRPMTSNFEGFSILDFIHYIYFPFLILEKEYFPFWMFSAKQGHYCYHFYNVFGMTRSLSGDWTRE